MTTEGMTQPAVEELQPPNHIPKSHATDNAPGQGYHPPHDARSKDVRESQTGAAESQAQADGPSPLTRRGSSMESRKSIYRGVQWDKNGQRWRARLYTDKTRHIGYFDDEDEAARAWDQAMLKSFGLKKENKLNFPEASLAQYKQEQLQTQFPTGSIGLGLGTTLPRRDSQISLGASQRFRGVIACDSGKFRATITPSNRRRATVLGTFDTAEEAARAYDRAVIQSNGRGALTNFPITDYDEEKAGKATRAQTKAATAAATMAAIQSQQTQQSLSMAAQQYLANAAAQQVHQQQAAAAAAATSSLVRSASLASMGVNFSQLYQQQAQQQAAQQMLQRSASQASLGSLLLANAAAAGAGAGTPNALGLAGSTNGPLALPGAVSQGHMVLPVVLPSQSFLAGAAAAAAAAQFPGTTSTGGLPPTGHAGSTGFGISPLQHQHQQLEQQQQQQQQHFEQQQQQQQQQQQHFERQQQQQQMQGGFNRGATPTPAPHQQHTIHQQQQRPENHQVEGAIVTGHTGHQLGVTPATAAQHAERKRPRSELNTSSPVSEKQRSGSRGMEGSVRVGSPEEERRGGSEQSGAPAFGIADLNAAPGVHNIGGTWRACLSIDLGTFNSEQDARRAYDRAALVACGFTAQTHAALDDAVGLASLPPNKATNTPVQDLGKGPQLLPAQQAQQAQRVYHGISFRNGSYLALLDIGGKPYELGPFGSETEAGKAYDRYSLILHGLRARTNHPLWEYLASAPEVESMLKAVGMVAQTQLGLQHLATAAAAAATTPAAAATAVLLGNPLAVLPIATPVPVPVPVSNELQSCGSMGAAAAAAAANMAASMNTTTNNNQDSQQLQELQAKLHHLQTQQAIHHAQVAASAAATANVSPQKHGPPETLALPTVPPFPAMPPQQAQQVATAGGNLTIPTPYAGISVTPSILTTQLPPTTVVQLQQQQALLPPPSSLTFNPLPVPEKPPQPQPTLQLDGGVTLSQPDPQLSYPLSTGISSLLAMEPSGKETMSGLTGATAGAAVVQATPPPAIPGAPPAHITPSDAAAAAAVAAATVSGAPGSVWLPRAGNGGADSFATVGGDGGGGNMATSIQVSAALQTA